MLHFLRLDLRVGDNAFTEELAAVWTGDERTFKVADS